MTSDAIIFLVIFGGFLFCLIVIMVILFSKEIAEVIRELKK